MIQTDELRGIITKRNMSQASVAKAIGITPKAIPHRKVGAILPEVI